MDNMIWHSTTVKNSKPLDLNIQNAFSLFHHPKLYLNMPSSKKQPQARVMTVINIMSISTLKGSLETSAYFSKYRLVFNTALHCWLQNAAFGSSKM